VPTDTPGFSAPEITCKLSLRASVTSELVLDRVRLPADAVLPGVSSLRGPLSCLDEARFGIVFGALGAARDCLEAAIAYSRDRRFFGRPVAGSQLTQEKLADMALEFQKGFLLAPHLGRLKDEGRLLPRQVSLGKLNNVRETIAIARTCRTILGANGITLEYPVMRHASNLESVLTSEVHTLVIGQALTGISAFQQGGERGLDLPPRLAQRRPAGGPPTGGRHAVAPAASAAILALHREHAEAYRAGDAGRRRSRWATGRAAPTPGDTHPNWEIWFRASRCSSPATVPWCAPRPRLWIRSALSPALRWADRAVPPGWRVRRNGWRQPGQQGGTRCWTAGC
jgi:hypothetical protein